MKFSDLIANEHTGRLDSHKLWLHIANAAASVIFVRIGWQAGPTDAVSFLFVVYLGCVAGAHVATQFAANKWGNGNGNGAPKGNDQ